MTRAGLERVLESHRDWTLGAGGRRAVLCGIDLRRVVLRDADLNGVVLRGADLRGADLDGACLNGADLRRADLRGADLSGADSRFSDMRDAALQDSDFHGSDLCGVDLRGADLAGAVGVSPLAAARLEILPRRGEVWGWKSCRGGVLVELVVPDGVERSNAAGRKCRARIARVVAVHGADVGVSRHDGLTTYRAGDVVECDRWEPDRWVECGGGIHFFLTREEAAASDG